MGCLIDTRLIKDKIKICRLYEFIRSRIWIRIIIDACLVQDLLFKIEIPTFLIMNRLTSQKRDFSRLASSQRFLYLLNAGFLVFLNNLFDIWSKICFGECHNPPLVGFLLPTTLLMRLSWPGLVVCFCSLWHRVFAWCRAIWPGFLFFCLFVWWSYSNQDSECLLDAEQLF